MRAVVLFALLALQPGHLAAGEPPRYVDHKDPGAYWDNRPGCWLSADADQHLGDAYTCPGERM